MLRFLAAVALLAAVIIGALVVLARFADGPVAIVPGGPFQSGELHTGPEPDWAFLADRETVEFQLVNPARSRTAWILEHDGRLFIPCGYMQSTWGRLWKQWPKEAEQDGRALLRVDGTLYPRELIRVRDGPSVEPVVKRLNRKYGMDATVEAVRSGALWLFEMKPQQ